MIKAIIFDVGNVLIGWNPDTVYRDYFGHEKKMLAFYQQTAIHAANLEMDRGRPFDEALDELSTQFPHYHEAIWLWKQRWTEMIAGPIDDNVAILQRLYQQGYPLYGLTNWSLETIPYVLNRYAFFDYFKDIVISGQEGCIKPERRIYDILLTRNQLNAEHCLFIDDSLQNINAAKKLGMTTLHVHHPGSLQTAIQALLPDLSL